MELRHLRYFVAVAEELNFSRAAERLHMAQPPLSQQIKQLEDELGFPLLTRTTRRVELTPAGASYLEKVREILAAISAAGEHAGRVASGQVGRMIVGCVGSATYTLLPQLARRMRADLPDVEFGFRGEMLSPDQVRALRQDRLDLGLMRLPPDTAGLDIHPIRSEPLCAAIPRDHPLAERAELQVTDLREQELVVHAGGGRSVMSGIVQQMCHDAGFTAQVAHEVAETSTIMTFVAAGLGIAVIPEPTSTYGAPGIAYVPIVDAPYVDLVAVTRSDETSPVVAHALEMLRELD
ncbi:DNA-binding transcriptional LysR family regulator [Nocardioides daedukensis]|uniref:DNA-binding transcriptional LysR family regulator n=1 Tax=Nocardioides daedukensis TaxID=634462 RepID=A0A7Y9RZT1_9ACTN|nr:LysR substrate-binding domain-containing protein [Nocardioides daedukensis]NYG59290.1 DNA-binding transcriptional LysR family regulator [Nocardioides daedukensis]